MAPGSARADPFARRPVSWLAKVRRWQRRGSCGCLSPLETRPPGHGVQPPRSPGPILSRLSVCQPFSPLGVIAMGHLCPAVGHLPGAWSLHPLLHLLSHARLGDLFPDSVPEEAPSHFYRGRGVEFCQVHSCRLPPPLVTPHHLHDARQRCCSPLGHLLLSQLFIREPLITTIVFIDAVSPQCSRFV